MQRKTNQAFLKYPRQYIKPFAVQAVRKTRETGAA